MSQQNLRRILRKFAGACALVVALFVTTGQAHAQWMVQDVTLLTSNEKGQASQLAQMVQQYSQMLTQYQAMMSSIGALQNIGLSSISNSQMTIINDAGPFVAQACPSATDPVGLVTGALGLNAASLTADIKKSQNQICQQITILEIHKYNTVAQILNEMNSYFNTIQGINQKADAIVSAFTNAMGDRQAVNNQLSQAQTEMNAKFANVQKQLEADDAAISALKAQQSILGNIALKGSGSFLGNAMQTVAFATALSN